MESGSDEEEQYTLSRSDIDGLMTSYVGRMRGKVTEIRDKTGNQIIRGILSAFAFVIALAWRDAIRKTIDTFVEVIGIPETAYFYEIIIALIITLVCVVGMALFSKLKEGTEAVH